MPDYLYPSSADLQLIEQSKLPRLIAQRPIFNIFPITNQDTPILMWEQAGNYLGLQAARGYDGEPTRVKPVGGSRFQAQPGVYGEFARIDELELTVRRSWGTFNTPIDVNDLVMDRQDQLLLRRLDRIEKIGWDLLTTGTFSVPGPAGTTIHTDTYTLQTYTASPLWSVPATSTPLLDLRAVGLLARGISVTFGGQARIFMNQTTLNNLLQNTNANDLAGRRQSGLTTVNNLEDVQRLFAGDNLPQIVPYDEGYYDESSTFQLFIPNGKAVVVGRRMSGAPVADYAMTRNANNPGMAPGPYTRVIDDPNEVPRTIEVHDGHNGGPRVFHPKAIVVMTV